jgi:hypothetical protein
MREIVVGKADLLIEESMPPVLLQLCAHVSGYQITWTRWKNDDFSDHLSAVPYPPELIEYARTSFGRLKIEQAALLGKTARKRRALTGSPRS